MSLTTFLAVVGALSLLAIVIVAILASLLAYRASHARRPYRDEHQGA